MVGGGGADAGPITGGNGSNGTPNTGGGGGGANGGPLAEEYIGGTGGSGVVIISVATGTVNVSS